MSEEGRWMSRSRRFHWTRRQFLGMYD